MARFIVVFLVAIVFLTACNLDTIATSPTGSSEDTPQSGELARVLYVIDGDTIAVEIDGIEERVRYIGVNTPERDEPCYQDATTANRNLVDGQTIRLVRDQSDTDRYDRLLRYVYVGNTFVNQSLVERGYAEAVLYQPDDEYYEIFRNLENQAANSGQGCHPTGIFNDGNDTR